LGRIGTQVKLHGLRIELEEIECVLREVEAVVEAVVVVKPELHGPGSEPGLVAYISPSCADVQSALGMCREKLPPYMVPSAVETLDVWPRNAAGKLDRAGLAARFVEITTSGGDIEEATSSKSGDMVQLLDSMAQMRRVNTRYLARREHVQSLLGISALLMCMYHWVEFFLVSWVSHDSSMWPLGELYRSQMFYMLLVDNIFVILFVACSAYISTISGGLGDQSDAFCFIISDAMLVLVFLLWHWPVPELVSSLLLLSTGESHFGAVASVQKSHNCWYAYRWVAFTLLIARIVTVLTRKVHLNHKVVLFLLALMCVAFSPKLGIVEAIFHVELELPHGTTTNCSYVFLYVGTVYYGERAWLWIEQLSTLVSRMWVQRVMAVVAILAIRITLGCDMVSSRPLLRANTEIAYGAWPTPGLVHIMSIVTVPTSALLMIIAVPNCSFLRFLGRNVLGVFLTHVAFYRVLCIDGISFFGILVVPSQWLVAGWIHSWACGLGWVEGMLFFILLLVYSTAFCVIVAPLFQLLLTYLFMEVAKLGCPVPVLAVLVVAVGVAAEVLT